MTDLDRFIGKLKEKGWRIDKKYKKPTNTYVVMAWKGRLTVFGEFLRESGKLAFAEGGAPRGPQIVGKESDIEVVLAFFNRNG